MGKLPNIEYTETIVPKAYHGTTLENAGIILEDGFEVDTSNEKRDPFLGDGIYFWEGDFHRAKAWAEKKYGNKDSGILCAEINLGKCLDLTNSRLRGLLKRAEKGLKQAGFPSKDSFVINWYAQKESFDTIRNVTLPKKVKKLFPGSSIRDDFNLVICVRNQKNISKLELIREKDLKREIGS